MHQYTPTAFEFASACANAAVVARLANQLVAERVKRGVLNARGPAQRDDAAKKVILNAWRAARSAA